MIRRLKTATAALHARLEGQNLARNIMDHSISLNQYKLLLLQNYQVYRQTEQPLQDFFPQLYWGKHKRLLEDLKSLAVDPATERSLEDFRLDSEAAAIGAAYVVLGSGLGGMLISREVQRCPALRDCLPARFFGADQRDIQAWRDFKELLQDHDPDEAYVEEAMASATATFEYFERSFGTSLGLFEDQSK